MNPVSETGSIEGLWIVPFWRIVGVGGLVWSSRAWFEGIRRRPCDVGLYCQL
jgi:hypothetical protein